MGKAVEVHGFEIAAGVVGVPESALPQAFGEVLGDREQSRVGFERESLAGAESLEQLDRGGPLVGRDGEGGAEVEQRDLADGVGAAFAGHEAERETRIPNCQNAGPL